MPPQCQGQKLTFGSLPAPSWSLCQALDSLTVLTLGTLPAPRKVDDTATNLIHVVSHLLLNLIDAPSCTE